MKSFIQMAKVVVLGCLFFLPVETSTAFADYSLAKASFEAQPLSTRYIFEMLLEVTGYWPAVTNDDFSGRLFKAINRFQTDNGLAATGLIGSRDLASLHALADPLLNKWGMSQAHHPTTNETLWIPQRLVPLQLSTSSGLTFKATDDSVSVAFSHLSGGQLNPIFQRLIDLARNHLFYKILRPDFFVVRTKGTVSNSYSRFQATPDGVTGFTLSWNADDPIHGERIATLMSDLFRAEFTLGQERYPPTPAALATVSNPAGTPQLPLAFASQSAPVADPVQVAQEQSRLQHEQARLAEVEQQKAEQMTLAARQLIADASSLIKVIRGHPRLLKFVEMINQLNQAIEAKDARAIEKRSMILSGALHKEPAYAEVESSRLAAQRRANAKYLGEALALAQRQKAFMLAYIVKSPASPATAAFLPLLHEIDPKMEQASLDKLQPFTEKVDLAIRHANLSDAFAGSSAPVPAAEAHAASTELQIAATDRNHFLLNGDLDDVVLMMNTSATAPHIARNLRGEVVFQQGRADACLYQKNASPALLLAVKTALHKLKATAVYVAASCDLSRIETYDIVAVNRGSFLNLDSTTALGFIRELETGAYKELSVLSGTVLKRQIDARAKASAAIAAKVAAGTRDGYGIILLKTSSPSICTILSDKAEGQRQLLASEANRLALDLNVAPVLVNTSAETAFVEVQRSRCGALYASAKDLKDLDAALTRQNIKHRFSALWFSQADVDAADKMALEAKAKAAEDAADHQRLIDDQRKLAAQRASDVASGSAAKQIQLRVQYAGPAQAAVSAIASEIKDFTDSHSGPAATQYPSYAAWLNDRLSDHWEVMSLNSDIDDYGVSVWKNRQLGTAFARITLRLKNSMLGEYQDACFIAGRMIDTEFSLVREPVMAPCASAKAINDWKTAHGFTSRWIGQ